MKTTLDLPESLVREMKTRAAQEGRKLKDVATEVFTAGLRAPDHGSRTALRDEPAVYRQSLDTPLFVCEESRARATSMTVAELLRLERITLEEEEATRVRSTL